MKSNNLALCFYDNYKKMGGQKAMSFCLQKGTNMSNKAEKACTPRSGEKQNDFISRCIKEEMNKGTPQKEAQGKCYGIWRGEKAKQIIVKSLNYILKRIISRIK